MSSDDDDRSDALVSFVSKLANQTKKQKNLEVMTSPEKKILSKKRIRRNDVTVPESEFATLGTGAKGLNIESLLQGKNNIGISTKDKVFQKESVDKPRAASVVADKVLRKSAFEEKAKDLDKWTQSIKVNRNAETLDLRDKSRIVNLSSASMVHKFTPTTEMEKEITKLLEGSGELDERSMVAKEEEEMDRSGLTEEQVKERQQELQRMRSLLFYEQQKRKRISKIKSKSYHRIRNRQNRRKAQLEAEAGEGSDVEKDEAEAEKEELKRMQERMSLKHKNTSKWAKEQLKKGNADSSTRKAIAEQLRLGEELLKKQTNADSDDESEDSDDEAAARDDAGLILFNTDPNNNGTTDSDKKSLLKSDSSSVQSQEKGILGMKFMQRAAQKQKEAARKEAEELLNNLNQEELLEFSEASDEEEEAVSESKEEEKLDEVATKARKGAVPDGSMQVGLLSKPQKSVKVDGVLDVAMGSKRSGTKTRLETLEVEENPWLEVGGSAKKSKRKRNEKGDNEEMSQATSDMLSSTSLAEILPENQPKNQSQKNKKSKVSTEDQTVNDQLDASNTVKEPSQAELVARAFASPDFESEFLKEQQKLEAEKNGENEEKEENDGWGSWAGAGVQEMAAAAAKKRKENIKNRSQTKGSAPASIKHHNGVKEGNKRKEMPLVSVSDKRIKKAAKLKVEAVPYPFTSKEQYERSLAVPVGKEWNAIRATRGFARPKVITNAGEVIAPVKLAKKSTRK